MSEKLATPQEFDETQTGAEPAPTNTAPATAAFKVVSRQPTVIVTIPAPGGKTRQVEIVDKSAFWSMPAQDLRARGYNIMLKPKSGRVIVTDIDGRHLAKFSGGAHAASFLAQAGVDYKKLPGGEALKAGSTKLK